MLASPSQGRGPCSEGTSSGFSGKLLRNLFQPTKRGKPVEESNKALTKPFSASHVNQMLVTLAEIVLVYQNRHGRYSFALPLLGGFISRQQTDGVLKNL